MTVSRVVAWIVVTRAWVLAVAPVAARAVTARIEGIAMNAGAALLVVAAARIDATLGIAAAGVMLIGIAIPWRGRQP